MTREEAKYLFRSDIDAYGKPKAVMTKLDKIFDYVEDLEHSFKNGKERFEAYEMSLEDCSEMTTKQALKIKELETKLSKYE